MDGKASMERVPEMQELLTEEPSATPTGFRARHAVLALIGMASLCAMAVAFYPAQVETQVLNPVQHTSHIGKLIKANAVFQVGRDLTDDEVFKVESILRRSAPKRMLAEVDEMDEDETVDEDDLEEMAPKMSKKCKEAVMKKMGEVMQRAMAIAINAMMICQDKGSDSKECEAEHKKMDALEVEMKKECKTNGNMCKVTETDPDGGKDEHEECVPKECHDEVGQLAELANKEAPEGVKVSIKC